MHLLLLLGCALCAWVWRLVAPHPQRERSWGDRWRAAWCRFLVPPLLSLAAAVAVLCMGYSGKMAGTSWLSGLGFGLAMAGVAIAVGIGLHLAIGAWQTLAAIAALPLHPILQDDAPNDDAPNAATHARLLDTDAPFAAQVGLWRSQLVVSRGLLERFDRDWYRAVLAHERAHADYRDPWVFFWLGWVRRLGAWLPGTQIWWEELLLLRELRADREAARHVDPLVLAEALLAAVGEPAVELLSLGVGFGDREDACRLAARIEALLAPEGSEEAPECPASSGALAWIAVALLPLAIVPFHY